MDFDLCKKYHPQTLSEVVGCNDFVQKLSESIRECKDGAYRGIVRGVSGSGKSTVPKRVLEHLGYHVISIDHMILTEDEDKFQQMITNFGNSKTIDHFMFQKKYALFIDSIDEISHISKKCYQLCISIFKSPKRQPMIITYTTSNEKNIGELTKQKKFPIFTISAPSTFETRIWLQNLLKHEEIVVDEELMNKYILHCQNKIGKILSNVRNIRQVLNIHEQHIDQHDQFVDRYTTDIAYDICSYPEKISIPQLDHILHYDHSSVATCIHENLATVIQERCKKPLAASGKKTLANTSEEGENHSQIDFMIDCVHVLGDGDILDAYVCQHRAWHLTSVAMLTKIGRLKERIQSKPKQVSMFRTFGFSSMGSKFTKQVQYFKRNTDMLMETDMTDVSFQVIQWHVILLACAVIAKLIDKKNAKLCTNKVDLEMTLQYVEDSKSNTLQQASPLLKTLIRAIK